MTSPSPPSGASLLRFGQIRADGGAATVERAVAQETPIALEYNGVGYAVLMATPADLDDLAYGFSLSERLIDDAEGITGIDRHDTPNGIILRVTLRQDLTVRILERTRHRATDASCGLCGIENLEQAMRPLPRVVAVTQADESAIFRALADLGKYQPLNNATGAVHAAALCDAVGKIQQLREDVGRHNAFDKLIGSCVRKGSRWDGGFALLSSRCSFELVEKAVLAGCPMLVTLSAPTALAIDRARDAGLKLAVLARSDSLLYPADEI